MYGNEDASDAAAASLPDPAAGAPVTFEQLYAFAREHSPRMGVARAERRRAAAARGAAEPLLPSNPEIGGGAGARITSDGTTLDVEASLSQSFEIAGERGLRADVADRTEERLDAQLADARWSLRAALGRAYLEALIARDRMAAAERVRELHERLQEIAERQVTVGQGSPIELRLAQGEMARAREQRVAARHAYRQARLALAELAGWPVAQPPEPATTDALSRIDVPLPAFATVAARHPQIRALRARVEEAEARLRLADREAWPEPSIGAHWRREGAGNATENVVAGTLTLPIPLWQRNQEERGAAGAELAIAEAELDAAIAHLRARFAQSQAALRAAAERVAIYEEDVIPRFEENLDMLRRSYELGEIDAVQVSLASERFLQIQNEALDARAARAAALGDLLALTGDWSPNNAPATEERSPTPNDPPPN